MNESSKKNSEKENKTMEVDEAFRILFDFTASNYDPDNGISIENTNYEMHINWQNFLKAGCDASLVANMMSPEDIWNHYDKLVAAGAQIDMTKLFWSEEGCFYFDEEFTRIYWDDLVSRGVSPDDLAHRCYCGKVYSIKDLENLLQKGVSFKKAFDLVSDWPNSVCEDHPKKSIGVLKWFLDHGFSKANIKEWLGNHMNSHMEDCLIEYEFAFCEKIELDVSDIVNHWIKRNGNLYFSDYSLSELPDAVSADKVVAFFSMKDIIKHCLPYDFSDFVQDYLCTGLDINVLAQKFMDEIGYSTGGPREAGALLDLVENGASADIIDPAKYLELVDVDTLNECEGQNWYRYFREHGYGYDELEKLSDYAVEDDEDY